MKIHKDRKDMTKRHAKLHQHLDELVACFFINTGLLASNITLLEFMEWSSKMAKDPTCAPVEKEDEVGS